MRQVLRILGGMPAERLNLPPIGAEFVDAFNPFSSEEQPAEDHGPFRIGELSRHSGVAVGTIKYYLREGLMAPGHATSKTQALYGGDHLRRLRLIRVLADVGGLSIAEIKDVTDALDIDGDHPPGQVERIAGYSIGTNAHHDEAAAAVQAAEAEAAPVDEALADARRATDAFVDALGFQVDAASPARAELADALHALRVLGFADNPLVFYEHARLAYELGSFEIGYSRTAEADPTAAVEAVMVGSVVFGSAFMALRRMTHEHETRRMLGI